jgi:phosphopantothenoylcysteine decarboxylase/phosphopantothenate--cysteine ligase
MAKKTLKGKEIILGICGGIAAYKACELIRMLRSEGTAVSCILTKNGSKFVTPLSLQTLSRNPVYQEMFDNAVWDIEHISLAQRADAIVVIPATADTIAKFANGRAEDLLSSVVLATTSPVLVCPAMNENMWLHPATQKNISLLKSYKYHIIEPQKGELACGAEGVGRLADLGNIMKAVWQILR